MYRIASTFPRARRSAHRGFTLLELVVVIGILITLAGLLVPILPNLLARSGYASGATNTGDLTKQILTYRALNGSFPDGYDVLTSGTSLAPTVLLGTPPTGFTVGPLADNGFASLAAAGIGRVYSMDTTAGHATYFSPANSTSAAIDATTNFLQVGTATLQSIFGQGISTAATSRYVVLGVGNSCTLVGARKGGVQEAPIRVAFTDSTGRPLTDASGNPLDPTRAYARFVAVFKVDTTGAKPAVLVCSAALDPAAGLLTTDRFVNSYYTDLAGSK
jgi:prepilin-type N-terminal cleavage/methylation domain-containing protein